MLPSLGYEALLPQKAQVLFVELGLHALPVRILGGVV